MEDYLKSQSVFDNNKEMVRNNLRSFLEEWYVSMEFRVDSNEVHKSCGRVWGIKIEKSIMKSIKFRVK